MITFKTKSHYTLVGGRRAMEETTVTTKKKKAVLLVRMENQKLPIFLWRSVSMNIYLPTAAVLAY